MIAKLLLALLLMSCCVVIHAAGVVWALHWLQKPRLQSKRFIVWASVFVRLAGWMVVCHLLEISVWAITYAVTGAMPDLTSAFYFSAVTYTTTGYGDLVLPQAWRLVGGVEALTGILMCGWSTGFFFAVVSQAMDAKNRNK